MDECEMQAARTKSNMAVYIEEDRKAKALYDAAVIADQNSKLSIFATRPAISSPVFNFITEMMGTVTLLLMALMIEVQVQ